MSETKVQPTHLRRAAVVYVRQSTVAQVEQNRESTRRQYDLAERARQFGWRADQVTVLDEDLGLSGATTQGRGGFARMTAQVALGHVGILLGLEVSRLARNNADWYRLLDLCGITDTLIGDADGVYDPNVFNDRLILGLKGTMSEAELHVLHARLDGGIRNKAARGELRCGLPVGLVWGERDGEIRLHPDEAVTGAVGAVFERFAEFGSVRRVWLWFISEKLTFPLRLNHGDAIRWVPPSYHAIHQVLTNPAYAGAYTHGKSRQERVVDENGVVRQRVRRVPRSEWPVLITDHHPGYIDWPTYEDNLAWKWQAEKGPLRPREKGPPGLACQHINPASSERGGARVAHRREPAIPAATDSNREPAVPAGRRRSVASRETSWTAGTPSSRPGRKAHSCCLSGGTDGVSPAGP